MRNIIVILLVIILGVVLIVVLLGRREPQTTKAPNESLSTNNESSMATFVLTSPVFEEQGTIPAKYTCDADNMNPPLTIEGVPEGAKSLVLIMDDPDIPESVKQARGIEVFDHWTVFNIPPETATIPEAQEPSGTAGANGTGEVGYRGPCPPDREHRYFFKLYALDIMLDLPTGSTKTEVERAMEGHILAQTELIGRYDRQR
jgi:Raf kinase inhibitor-like YbhB/YbcL family protein